MADLQNLVDALASLDEESAVQVISSVLQARPELAPPVVHFSVPDLTYPPSRALTERRSTGFIKSFNPQKGFGFIECAELHQVFGVDVFLHSKQVSTFEPGAMVSFAVVLSRDNKPQAFDLAPVQVGGGGAKGGGGEFGKGGGPLVLGGGKGGGGKGAGQVEESQIIGQFLGVIKSFSPQSGYGFMTCPDLYKLGYHNDVFLHHMQLSGHQVGVQVLFTCYLNSKNQPQAKDLLFPDGTDENAMKRLRMA